MLLNDVFPRNKTFDKIAFKLFKKIGTNVFLFHGIIKNREDCVSTNLHPKNSDTYVSALILPVLERHREKSQKYFDLLPFHQNLNPSYPCSTLNAMNFQKWELFSGSSDILNLSESGKRSYCKESGDLKMK